MGLKVARQKLSRFLGPSFFLLSQAWRRLTLAPHAPTHVRDECPLQSEQSNVVGTPFSCAVYGRLLFGGRWKLSWNYWGHTTRVIVGCYGLQVPDTLEFHRFHPSGSSHPVRWHFTGFPWYFDPVRGHRKQPYSLAFAHIISPSIIRNKNGQPRRWECLQNCDMRWSCSLYNPTFYFAYSVIASAHIISPSIKRNKNGQPRRWEWYEVIVFFL